MVIVAMAAQGRRGGGRGPRREDLLAVRLEGVG